MKGFFALAPALRDAAQAVAEVAAGKSLADDALSAKGRLLAPLDAYRSANRHRLLAMLGQPQGD